MSTNLTWKIIKKNLIFSIQRHFKRLNLSLEVLIKTGSFMWVSTVAVCERSMMMAAKRTRETSNDGSEAVSESTG